MTLRPDLDAFYLERRHCGDLDGGDTGAGPSTSRISTAMSWKLFAPSTRPLRDLARTAPPRTGVRHHGVA
jgi:hypothetical protein